jgi:hypothetical protein
MPKLNGITKAEIYETLERIARRMDAATDVRPNSVTEHTLHTRRVAIYEVSVAILEAMETGKTARLEALLNA